MVKEHIQNNGNNSQNNNLATFLPTSHNMYDVAPTSEVHTAAMLVLR
jgi:hypothetical protein